MAKIFQNTFFNKHAAFIWIMLVGLLLRVLFIEFQGLSNDELSAWYRTRFIDWDSFWNLAIKTGDMHPVFYQAFLTFWVKLFGDSELALRATGLVFYITNSLMIYKICNRFFSKNTGLGIIALYSCLTFTIINTTLARPYNSGTFFLLLLFWSILEINRISKKISVWHLGIIIGLLGAMTSHYFAFLTAGLIGVLGIFYLQKSRKKDIVICGILAILFFLPHWPVTEFQLGKGGLGWLPAPKLNWLIDFVYLLFNKSWILLSVCVLAFWRLILKTESKPKSREELFTISIFLFTYISAHLLSLFYTPILRDIVMLFLLPFLLIYLFRKLEFVPLKKFNNFIIYFPVLIGLSSIIFGDLLKPKNFGVFKEIAIKINETDKKIGLNKITIASNYNNVEYLNYYLNRPISETIEDWSNPETIYQLANRAKKSEKKYFIYSWSNSFQLPMYYEVIQKYFPKTNDQKTFFGSAFRLYSNEGSRKLIEQKVIIKEDVPLIIKSSDEFIGEFRINVKEINSKIQLNQYLLLKAKGELSSDAPLFYVVTAERNGEIVMNGEIPLLYNAYDQAQLNEIGKPTDFFNAFEIPKELLPTDQLKIYFWNPEKQKVTVEKTRIYFIGE